MASTTTCSAMDPSRLLTASSADPVKPALTETAISGRDVMPARRIIPTAAEPMPVSSAISSAYPARRVPANQTAQAATAKTPKLATSGRAV